MSDQTDYRASTVHYAVRRLILRHLRDGSLATYALRAKLWSKHRYAVPAVLAELVTAGEVVAERSHTGYRYRLAARPHGERWCRRCGRCPPMANDRLCPMCRDLAGYPPGADFPKILVLQPITFDLPEREETI